jgi:hypothetical protein
MIVATAFAFTRRAVFLFHRPCAGRNRHLRSRRALGRDARAGCPGPGREPPEPEAGPTGSSPWGRCASYPLHRSLSSTWSCRSQPHPVPGFCIRYQLPALPQSTVFDIRSRRPSGNPGWAKQVPRRAGAVIISAIFFDQAKTVGEKREEPGSKRTIPVASVIWPTGAPPIAMRDL